MYKKLTLSLLILQTAASVAGGEQPSPWRELLDLTVKKQQEVSLVDSLKAGSQAMLDLRSNALTNAKAVVNGVRGEVKDAWGEVCAPAAAFSASIQQARLLKTAHEAGLAADSRDRMPLFYWWLRANMPSVVAAVKSYLVPVVIATLAGKAAVGGVRELAFTMKKGFAENPSNFLLILSAVYGALLADRSKSDATVQDRIGRRMMTLVLTIMLGSKLRDAFRWRQTLCRNKSRRSVTVDYEGKNHRRSSRNRSFVNGLGSAVAFRMAYYLQSKQSARA